MSSVKKLGNLLGKIKGRRSDIIYTYTPYQTIDRKIETIMIKRYVNCFIMFANLNEYILIKSKIFS